MGRVAIKEGDLAPDFSLPEASGDLVVLHDELSKGPAILAFYPTDWGIVCTLEMKAFKTLVGILRGSGRG